MLVAGRTSLARKWLQLQPLQGIFRMFVTCFKGMAMKKLAFILFVIVSATSLIGCNTVQGVGKDISKGGQAIERAAN